MYIGVDGGGTKTAFVLINEDGQLLSSYFCSTCSYLTEGVDAVRTLLELGVNELISKSDVALSDVKFAYFGLPSYGEDARLQPALDALPSNFMAADRYRCGNDMVCGWAGSLGCDDGINIVAGTGSISYGEHDGKSARCGGWGELFGDEGSGYWVAREGLTLFSRMSDGRVEQGPLHGMLRQHLNLENDLDLPGIIYDEWEGLRHKIAALAQIVNEAAHTGDEEARKIFTRAGRELAGIVEATRRQLSYRPEETVKLSYSGGVFNAGKMILNPFIEALESEYSIIKPRFVPAIGAALYAARCHGFTFSENALATLKQQELEAG